MSYAIGVVAADLTLDDILAQGKTKFDNANTVSVSVYAQMADPSTKKKTKMGMAILADKTAGLSRISFTAPAAFKGQIIIVDDKAKVMKMYMPVTNQVVVSKLNKGTGAAMGMNFDLSSAMGIPDKTTHDAKLLGKEKVGKIDTYVLQFKDKKDAKAGIQKIWLNVSDLTPVKLELFDSAQKSIGVMEFKDLKIGVPIDRKKIVSLPAGAEVIEG
jgi:outer membrane lipoprotein-sorting protein